MEESSSQFILAVFNLRYILVCETREIFGSGSNQRVVLFLDINTVFG